MTVPLLFAGIALILGGYLTLRHPHWVSVALFLSLLLSVPEMILGSLGNPKPLWAGCGLTKESTVLGYSLVEGRAIYLWIDTDSAPLSCQLPWSEQQAAQINDADQRAHALGVPLKIKMQPPQAGTKDDEKPMAYPAPQPALPLKQGG